MFKSLYLQNFKCFREIEKPLLFSHINLLTGSNGRGKSSIFQSMLLLSQSYESGKDLRNIRLTGRYLSLGTYKDVIYGGNTDDKISIKLTTDNEKDNNLLFVCKLGSAGIDTSIDNIYVNDIPLGSETTMGMSDNNGMIVEEHKNINFAPTSTYESFSQLANVYYISADRIGPQNSAKMLEDLVDDKIGIHGEKVINSLYERNVDFQKLIAKELSLILGGASINVTSSDFEYIRMYVDSVDGSKGFKPVNVGFGYSYILPIVVLPLIIPSGSKLFIENPEAHLHPGAQSRVMDFLIRVCKEKNIQLFIETHSDHIVNSLRIAIKEKRNGLSAQDATLIHLDRENTSKQPVIWQIEIDKDGNLSDYPHDFLEEWGNQMSMLV